MGGIVPLKNLELESTEREEGGRRREEKDNIIINIIRRGERRELGREGGAWKGGGTEEDRGSCFSTMQVRDLDTKHTKLVPRDPDCRDM